VKYETSLLMLLTSILMVVTACGVTTDRADKSPEAGQTSAGQQSSTDVEIKIGYMGGLTGGAAEVGQEQLHAVQTLVQLFNEENGFDVEVVEGDTQLNPDTGKIVAERFIADNTILGVIGPLASHVCEATQPSFEEGGLVAITPSCSLTNLTDPGTETFFRPIPHDAQKAPTDAGFVANELEAESVYLVDDQSIYAVGLNDEMEAQLKELGITDVQRASVTQEEIDFSSLVTSILVAYPDVVYFPSLVIDQYALLVIRLQQQNYQGAYFLIDGAIVPSWVEAIERCFDAGALTRSCAVEETAATNMSDSVLGIPVSFGPGNQIEGLKFTLYQVQNGSFVPVE
jgi:ABC-type branched-subunit amino acid transport system substrate-binding protein